MPKASAKRRLQFGDDHEKESEADVSPMTAVASLSASASVISAMNGSSSIVLATPEKKRRRHSNDGCESDEIRNHNKQGIALYFSPSKTTTDARTTSVLVTPEKKEDEENGEEHPPQQQQQEQQHVPTYIHKNLNYHRRGQAFLNETLKRVFDLVEEHYVIPSDFESNRSYGPLSGTCFEERAVNAYDRGLLLPNHLNKNQNQQPSNNDEGCGSVLIICTHCAALAHRQEDCPDLI